MLSPEKKPLSVKYEENYFIDSTKPVWNYSLFTEEDIRNFQYGTHYSLYKLFGNKQIKTTCGSLFPDFAIALDFHFSRPCPASCNPEPTPVRDLPWLCNEGKKRLLRRFFYSQTRPTLPFLIRFNCAVLQTNRRMLSLSLERSSSGASWDLGGFALGPTGAVPGSGPHSR